MFWADIGKFIPRKFSPIKLSPGVFVPENSQPEKSHLEHYTYFINSKLLILTLRSFLVTLWQCSEIFFIPKFKIWSVSACSNCNFSIPLIIYWASFTWKSRYLPFFQFPGMIKIYNLHWGYPITNEIDRWRYQLDHVNLSQKGFWSVNYIVA